MNTQHSSRNTQHAIRNTQHAIRNTQYAIFLLSFALHLYLLDGQPIWWDEGISIHLARSSLSAILADRAGNLHPPLYFFLLKGWVMLAGDSPFSVRFLSALFATLLVPAMTAFARRWLGRPAGLVAAALAAFSPLYLVYAQEARVYALLPLLYLALLALYRRLLASPRRQDWVLLAAVEFLALGTHYMALFAVAYVVAVLLIRLRSPAHRLRLLAVQSGVALFLLPWLLFVLGRADALTTRLGMSNWQAEPVTPVHLIRLLWTFQLTGLPGLIADPLAVWLTGAVALAVLLLLFSIREHPQTLPLLLDWLLPLSSAAVVWYLRPLSHPRYVIIFTPPLLLLLTLCLTGARRRYRWFALYLALSLFGLFGLGLVRYHDPRFAKDDTRGVAAALAARAAAGDLILVPPEDWSVPYYYDGPAPVEMVWPAEVWERLPGLTRAGQTVFLVDYYRASRDPAGLLPFGLEAAGSLVERWDFAGLYVRVYRLDRAAAPPPPVPRSDRFGPLTLTGVWVEDAAPADTALTLALRWRLTGPVDVPLHAGLRLRDGAGWTWADGDDPLLTPQGRPTDRWPVGSEITTYHLLPLPPGTPPLTYTVTVGVYRVDGDGVRPLDLLDGMGNPRGQSLDVAALSLAAPLGLSSDPYRMFERIPRWKAPVPLGSGLLLEGASLDRTAVSPGQSIYVTLHWRSTAPRPLTATLALEQGGSPLAAVTGPVGGLYPCERWAEGQSVVEHRRLTVPPTAGEGAAAVVLRAGAGRVELGVVEVSAAERSFEPPVMGYKFRTRFGDVAELVGYDLPAAEVTAGEPVTITLYWRALEGAGGGDYTVFAHILSADGRLVGQHDGPPAEGTRPTVGWLPGEVVADRHVMAFRQPYAGPARIEVGLYDPLTMERVFTERGETFVLLPTELTITEP